MYQIIQNILKKTIPTLPLFIITVNTVCSHSNKLIRKNNYDSLKNKKILK